MFTAASAGPGPYLLACAGWRSDCGWASFAPAPASLTRRRVRVRYRCAAPLGVTERLPYDCQPAKTITHRDKAASTPGTGPHADRIGRGSCACPFRAKATTEHPVLAWLSLATPSQLACSRPAGPRGDALGATIGVGVAVVVLPPEPGRGRRLPCDARRPPSRKASSRRNSFAIAVSMPGRHGPTGYDQ